MDARAEAGPGVRRGTLTFADPILAGYSWPRVDIVGRRPGPRLSLIAGMHVNEVSSIEAAVRLQSLLDPAGLAGTVSILPVVNVPGLYEHSQYICPIDGKNINFTFPGRPGGSFSEALCHALLTEWAAGSAALIDMHGGDLRENVAKFVVFQATDDTARTREREALARCFDADLLVRLDPSHGGAPGRSCTHWAMGGGLALLTEAGANGLIDEASVAFHLEGVLNVARRLGMIEGPAVAARRGQILCDRYLWIPCPADGMMLAAVEPAQRVARGEMLAEIRDVFGQRLAVIEAPADGHVLWRMTQPFLRAGEFAMGLATSG